MRIFFICPSLHLENFDFRLVQYPAVERICCDYKESRHASNPLAEQPPCQRDAELFYVIPPLGPGPKGQGKPKVGKLTFSSRCLAHRRTRDHWKHEVTKEEFIVWEIHES